MIGYGLRVAAVPADDFAFLHQNLTADVVRVHQLYRLVLLQPRESNMRGTWLYSHLAERVPSGSQIAWGIVLQYLAAILVAPVLGIAWLRGRRSADPARTATLLYLSLLVAVAVAVSTLVEFGENQRIRVETDPIVCVIATPLAVAAWRWWRARTGRQSATPSR